MVESYKLLQPEGPDRELVLLYALLAANRVAAPFKSVLPAATESGNAPVSDRSRWVNGLWFTSLVTSLGVALLSILVKQWLDEYTTRTFASAKSTRHWVRRRAFYFRGISRWHVLGLISVLPLLLHVSLFLFFGGLVVFLWDLDRAIAIFLLTTSTALFTFYVTTLLAPLSWTDCPSATPLLRQIRTIGIRTKLSAAASACWVLEGLDMLGQQHRIQHRLERRRSLDNRHDGVEVILSTLIGVIQNTVKALSQHAINGLSLLSADGRHAMCSRLERSMTVLRQQVRATEISLELENDSLREDLDGTAIRWLILDVSNTDAVSVGLQALGAIGPASALAESLRADATVGNIAKINNALTTTRGPSSWSATELLRSVRGVLCVRRIRSDFTLADLGMPEEGMLALRRSPSADLRLLVGLGDPDVQWGLLPRDIESSGSLTSTALLLLLSLERDPQLAVTTVVQLISCMKLDSLTGHELAFIIRIFQEVTSLPPCTARHNLCNALCVIELAATLLMAPPTACTAAPTWPMLNYNITQLIPSIYYQLSQPMQSLVMQDAPRFLELARSDTFLHYNLADSARMRLAVLRTAIRVGYSMDQSTLSSYHRAAVHLLAEGVHNPQMVGDVRSTILDELGDMWAGILKGDGSDDHKLHSFLLQEHLHHWSGNVTVWQLFNRPHGPECRSILGLASTIAEGLLDSNGDPAHPSRADAYFAEEVARTGLECVLLQKEGAPLLEAETDFEHLARICIRLRPLWWIATVERIVIDETCEHLRDVAARIDQRLCAPSSSAPSAASRLETFLESPNFNQLHPSSRRLGLSPTDVLSNAIDRYEYDRR